MADVIVAEFHAYFGDGSVCVDQKFLSRADFEPNQILSGGDAQNFLEVMTEARNAHVGEAANLLDRDVLREVCVDEVFAMLKRRVEISPLNDFFSRQLLQDYQQGVEQMVTCDARRYFFCDTCSKSAWKIARIVWLMASACRIGLIPSAKK